MPVGDRQAGFYSRYFLIPKRDGGLRPILDLRPLNRFLRSLRCRMLTIPRLRGAVNAGDWFVTVDLKDAYFQVPIWQGHWWFLRFGFEGLTYEFQVLPFGIALAPRTFTRCMDTVLAPLLRRGLRVLNYLDNWLLCAASEEECRQHLDVLLCHVRSLGLVVNFLKSRLQPAQVTFLGLVLDSNRSLISLSPVRQRAFLNCLLEFQLGAWVMWRCCHLLVVAQISRRFGQAAVDLFASRESPLFLSPAGRPSIGLGRSGSSLTPVHPPATPAPADSPGGGQR